MEDPKSKESIPLSYEINDPKSMYIHEWHAHNVTNIPKKKEFIRMGLGSAAGYTESVPKIIEELGPRIEEFTEWVEKVANTPKDYVKIFPDGGRAPNT